MANKPTEEELKQKEEEAKKIADELEDRQQIPQDEEENEPEKVEDEQEEEVEPSKEEAEEDADPSKEYFKKEVSASSRENQRIYAKNRVLNKALVEAEEIPEPTEEEMKSIYRDDWDLMSDIDKDLAKETIISKKWRSKISEASNQANKIEKWYEQIDTFIDDPKTLIDNPELEGKTEEFREFANNPENNSVPFKTLIGAFMYENSKNQKSNKGGMFIRSKGGSNEKPQPKSDKISLDDARKLRETNYSKYKELLIAGKIESDL